jgi:hypothetical protein
VKYVEKSVFLSVGLKSLPKLYFPFEQRIGKFYLDIVFFHLPVDPIFLIAFAELGLYKVVHQRVQRKQVLLC